MNSPSSSPSNFPSSPPGQPQQLPAAQRPVPAAVALPLPVPGAPPAALNSASAPFHPLEFRSLSVHGSDEPHTSKAEEERSRQAAAAGAEATLAARLAAARDEGVKHGDREGYRRGRVEQEAESAVTIARERQNITAALHEFAAERQRYFAAIEQQVVKLALAIAARILHRQAQMDGLLLAGAVRVALETIADSSGVVLRSAEADAPAWRRFFETAAPDDRPNIVVDPALVRGDCVLETRMGTVELGVNAQLEEIERGFFDLLSQRPQAAVVAPCQ